MTTPTTALQFPTADNTNGTADTTYFTADGADLINGGATPIPQQTKKNPLSYTVSANLPY
jgi:hypothetical protein